MRVENSWGVLISQTASEIVSLSKALGVLPGLVVTNNLGRITAENLQFFEEHDILVLPIPNRPSLKDYLFPDLLGKRLITLHGYLRIIPPEFLTVYTGQIYNGHPALITKYPELKGFNMQEAIAGKDDQYPTIGSVIHEVISEVDAGKVVVEVERPNNTQDVDQAYSVLRETSFECWKYFFGSIWKFR